jgi:hypothetical protein
MLEGLFWHTTENKDKDREIKKKRVRKMQK